MKLKQLKQKIYQLTCTANTKQLKKERLDLVKDRDLRYKSHWLQILQQLKIDRELCLDISWRDLEVSEKMLKESLLTVGGIADLTEQEIEIDWQRIKLENQFADIHVEEL